jgi:hypothetical protein
MILLSFWVILLEEPNLDDDISEDGEKGELETGAEDPEEEDVFYVFEELLPLHVIARSKHDRGQTKVEEEVLIEGHHLVKFIMPHPPS